MNIKLVDKEDARTRYISPSIRNIKLVDKEDVEKIDGEVTLVDIEDVLNEEEFKTNHINCIQKLEMNIKLNDEGKIIIEEIPEWY